MKSIKPKFERPESCGYGLIYSCGKCGREFAMVDSSFFYCPTCGAKIDWGVVTRSNAEWLHKYRTAMLGHQDSVIEELKCQLARWNDMIDDGVKREMPVTDLTRKEILTNNIDYYMNQGWGKLELIEKGFFTEEDFEFCGK